jgi:Uma2 family endonuclease
MAANPDNLSTHFFSLDEYFALEHAGDARYEYWDGEIVCMSGGTRAHGRIVTNVVSRFSLKLAGKRCETFTGDTAVKTPTRLPYRYPDVSVGCSELEFENIRGIDVLLNPVLIVEVLSPSTALRDSEQKFEAYQAIQSFSEYLLIAQDAPHVTQFLRQQNGRWTREAESDVKASLRLDSIDIEIPLEEIYENVRFVSA